MSHEELERQFDMLSVLADKATFPVDAVPAADVLRANIAICHLLLDKCHELSLAVDRSAAFNDQWCAIDNRIYARQCNATLLASINQRALDAAAC